MRIFTLALVLVTPYLAAAAENSFVDPMDEPTLGENTLRSKVMDLAGAFSNDDYKIRDGFWFGAVEAARPKWIEVNLFAGNHYWFAAAAQPSVHKMGMSVLDATGNAVPGENYESGNIIAVGVAPEKTGRYYIKLQIFEGETANFCLLYWYK